MAEAKQGGIESTEVAAIAAAIAASRIGSIDAVAVAAAVAAHRRAAAVRMDSRVLAAIAAALAEHEVRAGVSAETGAIGQEPFRARAAAEEDRNEPIPPLRRA